MIRITRLSIQAHLWLDKLVILISAKLNCRYLQFHIGFSFKHCVCCSAVSPHLWDHKATIKWHYLNTTNLNIHLMSPLLQIFSVCFQRGDRFSFLNRATQQQGQRDEISRRSDRRRSTPLVCKHPLHDTSLTLTSRWLQPFLIQVT